METKIKPWICIVVLAVMVGELHPLTAQQLASQPPRAAGLSGPASTAAPKTEVLPPTQLYGIDVVEGLARELEAVDAAALRAEDDVRATTDPRKTLRIGIPRDLELTIDDGKWYSLPGLGRLWVLDIISHEALGIRLRFDELDLPRQAELHVHAPSLPGRKASYSHHWNGPHEVWSASMYSDRIRVEYYEPRVIRHSSSHQPFFIGALQHIYRDPIAEQFSGAPSAVPFGAGSCHNDVSCDLDPTASLRKRSVARISYVDGALFTCSGALLNNLNSDFAPYLMTAQHAISTPEIASTAEFYWRFETSACNGSPPSLAAVPQSAGGALLVTDAGSDFSLLRVDGAIPTSLLHWAGWDPAGVAPHQNGNSIHHPAGTHKRISYGQTAPGAAAGFLRFDWNNGPTEPGSSGAPLFLTEGPVQGFVGQLCCGPSSCGNESFDDFGAWSSIWPSVAGFMTSGSPDDDLEDNDDCSSAAAISSGDYGIRWVKLNDPDWYRVTVPTNAMLDVEVDFIHSFGDIDVTLHESCGGPALVSSTSATSDESIQYYNLGTTRDLFLHVSLIEDALNAYALLVSVTPGAVPNDDCSDAFPIVVGTTPFNNIGATTDGPDEPTLCLFFSNSEIGSDVWFVYEALAPGLVEVSLCNSTYDTKLAVYSGESCPGPDTAIACDDDSCPMPLRSVVTFPVVTGETYLLRVGGYQGEQGSGVITLIHTPPDDCVDAVAISDGVHSFSTSGATTDGPLELSCTVFGNHFGSDLWFQYTASCDGVLTIDLCASTYDTMVALYGGFSCPTTDSVLCDDDFCSFQSRLEVTVEASDEILIRVGGFNGAQGDCVMDISCGPANETCALAETIVDGTVAGSLAGAAGEQASTCTPGTSPVDVWYTYVAPHTGRLFVSTCGTNDLGGTDLGVDTILSVYSSCDATEPNQIVCNDDAFGTPWSQGCQDLDAGLRLDSAVSFDIVAGDQIWIRVQKYQSTPVGPFRLTVSCTPYLSHDDCASATPLSTGSFAETLEGASADGHASCDVFNNSMDVWYEFTAPANGTLQVTTCGTHDGPGVDQGIDTILSLHEACDGSPASEVDCNDDTSSSCSLDSGVLADAGVATTLTSGETILIRVTSGDSLGPFELDVAFIVDPCSPASDVNCTTAGPAVTIDWTNGEPYAQITVRRDGNPIAALDGAATSFSEVPPAGSSMYSYSIEGLCNGVMSAPTSCLVSFDIAPDFRRGDCNSDGQLNIADAVWFLANLFPGAGGPNRLACLDACDGNDDGLLNIADAVVLLSSLFGSPAAPLPAPFPGCGTDPSRDALSCATSACP